MPVWLWALAPMLLAAALVVPVLGRDILGGDESSTLRHACAGHLGPCSPAEAIQVLLSLSPDQAWGIPILFSQWGQLVGWSEFATRALPWLAGPLTIAWVYRLGRDLFTPAIALAAAVLLSTSTLFLIYMYIARLFGPAMLFTAIALWGYWRVAIAGRRPKRGGRATLLLGATAVLYAHYFSALLVPALGLFHLFFVRKERRWWQATVLLVIAVLLALPQAPGLLAGIEFTAARGHLHSRALQPWDVLALFFRYLSNDLLQVPGPVAGFLLPAMVALVLWAFWNRRQRPSPPGSGWYLTLATVLLGLLSLAANELAQVLEHRRVRYLAGLWPPAVLLTGVVVDRLLRRSLRWLALGPVVLIAFAGVADFLWQGDLIRHNWRRRLDRATIPVVNRIALEAAPDRLLFVDPSAFGAINHSYELYTGIWGDRRVPLYPDSLAGELVDRARDYQDVWLLYLTVSEASLQIPELVDELTQIGWVGLLDWQDGQVTLQHLRSPLQK
ncbi:MAG: glycosyltransferase family 39 protein [Anaerolineaceae bacterium]|nr:glycosyltransferase family 39 protein [Anaerolineaceae bacterium]